MSSGFSVRQEDGTKLSRRPRLAFKPRRVRRQVASAEDSETSGSEAPDSESEEEEEEILQVPASTTRTTTSTSTLGGVTTTNAALPAVQPTTFSSSTRTTTRRHELTPGPFPTQPTPAASNSRLGLAPSPEGISSESPTPQTRAHKTLSHDATIALEVIGIFVGVSIFLGICFIIFRRHWRRRQKSGSPSTSDLQENGKHMPPPPRKPLLERVEQFFNRSPPPVYSSEKYVPPAYEQSNRFNQKYMDSGKPDSFSQNEPAVRGHTRTRSEDSRQERRELRGGAGAGRLEVPRKAFLKRNTGGKLVMRPSDPATPAGSGDQRIMIEASGEWDEARTVARASLNTRTPPEAKGPLAGVTAALRGANVNAGGGRVNDAAPPSGGNGNLRNAQEPEDRDDLPTYYREQQGGGSQNSQESGVLGGGFANLGGLRKGDGGEEYERLVRERQSMMSGTVRSTTSWNTSVFGRLEKEREKFTMKENQKMEAAAAAAAGGTAGARDSTISVPRWRDPVSWVKDQIDRRDNGRGPPRDRAGMERLDG